MTAVGPSACWRERLMMLCEVHVVSLPSADPLGLAEQALWPDQQHDDEHEQRADELELRRHEQAWRAR